MSTPIATSDDLALYMGVTVDEDRADFLLGIAQAYCEDIVSPLPASAVGIVLAATARAYVNPQQNTNEAAGPFTVGRAASIYLTRTERATLRRAAGRAGAGSTSTLSPGVNAVQSVTVSATAGTYTLALGSYTTGPIAYNASAAAVQTALEGLANIGAGNVSVTGSYVVTFINSLGAAPIETLTVNDSALTGSVTVEVSVLGSFAPGSNMPPWSYDYSSRWQG